MNIGKHRVHLSPFQNKKGAAEAAPSGKSLPAPKARQPQWQIAQCAQHALAVAGFFEIAK
jgi:hypothetical protein